MQGQEKGARLRVESTGTGQPNTPSIKIIGGRWQNLLARVDHLKLSGGYTGTGSLTILLGFRILNFPVPIFKVTGIPFKMYLLGM